MARRTVRLRIVGRVQGVGYRDWLIGRARGLKLDGWVRNAADGSVEALIVGDAEQVEIVIAACQAGPRAARVTDVVAKDDAEIPPPGFARRPDA